MLTVHTSAFPDAENSPEMGFSIDSAIASPRGTPRGLDFSSLAVTRRSATKPLHPRSQREILQNLFFLANRTGSQLMVSAFHRVVGGSRKRA